MPVQPARSRTATRTSDAPNPRLSPSSCGCGVLTGPRSAVSAGAAAGGRPANSKRGRGSARGTMAKPLCSWTCEERAQDVATSNCASDCAPCGEVGRRATTGALSTWYGRADLESSETGLRREAQERRYRFEPASDSRPGPDGRTRGRPRGRTSGASFNMKMTRFQLGRMHLGNGRVTERNSAVTCWRRTTCINTAMKAILRRYRTSMIPSGD